MRYGISLLAMLLMSAPSYAKEAAMPDGIKVVTEAQIGRCNLVDIVSAMRFALVSASKTQKAALVAALEKAKAVGANAAVITSITADKNQHQVTLTAYSCPQE